MEDNMYDICRNCKYREAAEKSRTPDLGEMIKLAMMVSKMFGQGAASRQSPSAAPASAAETALQSGSSQEILDYDSLIQDKRIKIIKASIPFLHPEIQKYVHLTAKFLEITNIVNSPLYTSRIRTSSYHEQPVEELSLGMLRAVSPHLDEGERQRIEAACKALEMISIMKSVEKIRSGKEEEKDGEEVQENDIPELQRINT